MNAPKRLARIAGSFYLAMFRSLASSPEAWSPGASSSPRRPWVEGY